MTTEYIVSAIITFIILYTLMGLAVSNFVKVTIEEYNISYIESNSVKSLKLNSILQTHKDFIVVMAFFLHPIFAYFLFGCWVGKWGYDIIIKNYDENRVASWVF
jgi:ABC-type uncharacterized transport system permease subunit